MRTEIRHFEQYRRSCLTITVVVLVQVLAGCSEGEGCKKPSYTIIGCSYGNYPYIEGMLPLRVGDTSSLSVFGVGECHAALGGTGCIPPACPAREVRWASSNPDVAGVTPASDIERVTLRALAPGTTEISASATSDAGVTVAAVVLVENRSTGRLTEQPTCRVTVTP